MSDSLNHNTNGSTARPRRYALPQQQEREPATINPLEEMRRIDCDVAYLEGQRSVWDRLAHGSETICSEALG